MSEPEDRHTQGTGKENGGKQDADKKDGDKQDGETPKETAPDFVKSEDLLEQFGINHLKAEIMVAGRRPSVKSMFITQEDFDRHYKEEEDPIAPHTKKHFYFSCPPYRPSAVVAYVDSPWLLKQLKPVGLDDLTIDTHHRGKSIRLTNTGYSRRQYGWLHCGVEDSVGTKGRIVLYNTRFDCPVETALPHFAEFIVKEPFFTLHCDGKVAIRVDHPSDLIISSPYTRCIQDKGGLIAYPTENLVNISRHLFNKGCMAYNREEWDEGDLWFRDVVWLTASAAATETDDPELKAECLYRSAQSYRGLVCNGPSERIMSDFYYLRVTASIGGRIQFAPLPGIPHPNDDPRNCQNLAALSAMFRGDFRTAAEHYNEFVKRADLSTGRTSLLLKLRDDLNLRAREQEQESGVYSANDIFIDAKGEYKANCASFLKKVIIDKDKKCLRATCAVQAGQQVLMESAFESIDEESLSESPEILKSVREMERVEYFEGDGGLRKMTGAHAALVPAVLAKCMSLFVTTRERTSLFDEVPRDCKLQEPYDIFHIHEVVFRHAMKWESNPDDPANSFQSTAIWPTSAYVRGSDNPNVKGMIFNKMLCLIALREIEKGEVLTMRNFSTGNFSTGNFSTGNFSTGNNEFRYKEDENYNGGDPEPFMPARSDAPPPPIIDPGAWLFGPEDRQVAVEEQSELEMVQTMLLIAQDLRKKGSEVDEISKRIEDLAKLEGAKLLEYIKQKSDGTMQVLQMIKKKKKDAEEERNLRQQEYDDIAEIVQRNAEKQENNLRLKHLVKLMESILE